MNAKTLETPYWWEGAPLQERLAVDLAKRCDVVVVGAGYAGLSAALTLARAGRDVHVLEKDCPGEGASSRNGGIASGNIRIGFRKMMDTLGRERALAIYGESKAAREDLARFIRDEGIECGYSLVGRFTGAVRPAHYDGLARESELLRRELGIEAYVVPRAEQHTEIGTDLYHGGAVRPDIGGLHPGLFHRGLLERAERSGAVVHGWTPALGLRRESDGFEIGTSRGKIFAHDVVIATNGYTGRHALPWLARRLVPVASQIIATETLDSEVMNRLMPKRRMLGETRHLYHYYRPSPGGTRILFGGRRGANTDDPNKKMSHLYRQLITIFPELDGVSITHCWWGLVAMTYDELPKLAVHEGVHYATGFCGSGVVWARWLGRKAALRILGDPQAETAFDDAPFRAIPLYDGRPWFVPAAIVWQGFKDRMGWY
ncbi:MAG: FAD-binding oxidoreductase [Betaproteobacteria bacterium]|nr:FAD-binding oxidoreductase [Gammaproteobacteria bacterium]MDH3435719.1 FAD-binding oxidoreductase [Betaproteobacteria bacterium]